MTVGNRLPADVAAEWGDFGGPAAGADRASQGISPLDFLHALRRRWGVALALAIATALAVMILTFFLVPAEREAAALLEVRAAVPSLSGASGGSPQEGEVERFKQTQLALAKSLLVVNSALRKPEINTLPALREEKDQVRFLLDEVRVNFLGRSDIMVVSMSSPRGDDAKKIVEAMVRAYLEEIVYADQKEKIKRIETLTRLLTELTGNLNNARKDYIATVEAEGAIDTKAAQANIDMEMRRLNEFSSKMFTAEQDARTAALKAMQADEMYKIQSKPSAIKQEVQKVLMTDPLYQKTHADYQQLLVLKRSQEQRGIRNPQIDDEIRQREELLKAQDKSISQKVRDLILKGPLRDQVRMAANEANVKGREAVALRDAYVKLGEDIKKRIRRASGLSAQRDTVEKLETQVREMAATLHRSQLDQWTGSRVELVQPADIPPQTDLRRWMLIIGGGALAFCLTGFGVGCWEFAKKRVNSAREVSDKMRINVVGTLPKLSGQSWLGRKSPTELEAILGDSIDSIRAALMHGAQCGRRGAVMVTSAWDGEGKTTVASQLAVSLARCGRRTLLVDADLRNPTLHQLFEMPLGRGLGDVLRGDIEVEDGIRPTQAENLKLLSGGASDYTSIQALENDSVGAIFDRLKEQFDFIVVDTAPVLAFADPLLLGQHMDGAILSVRLDVSQRPKVEEAANRLRTVGINLFGAVVNGTKAQTSRRGAADRALEAPVEV
jgi:capsular exopolysaccharide synthesis family protein